MPGVAWQLVYFKMANHFTIEIPAKKYVKTFFVNVCGDPVDLKHLPELLDELRTMLERGPRDQEIKLNNVKTESVRIIIPPDWFYRYGYELSYQNCLYLNELAEKRLKFLARQYITLNNSLGVPVVTCIREFQKRYGLNEEIWNLEAIKKDYDRHGQKIKIKFFSTLKEEIRSNLLNEMEASGIVYRGLKNTSSVSKRKT